jgi:hypothetical protein
MAITVKPILLALVLCDMIIREMTTNKLSLIGTFNSLSSQTFPCVHQTFWVYVAITEGRGRQSSKLRITSLSTGQTIFELPGEIEFGGPTSVGELVFQLNAIRFDTPGLYAVEFWAGDDMLGSRKIHVQKHEIKTA